MEKLGCSCLIELCRMCVIEPWKIWKTRSRTRNSKTSRTTAHVYESFHRSTWAHHPKSRQDNQILLANKSLCFQDDRSDRRRRSISRSRSPSRDRDRSRERRLREVRSPTNSVEQECMGNSLWHVKFLVKEASCQCFRRARKPYKSKEHSWYGCLHGNSFQRA